MAKEIKDFGQKIGGAKKDTWKSRGLTIADLVNLTEAEAEKYITRDYVWPLPNAKKEVDEQGIPRFISYWRREIRRNIRKTPLCSGEDYIRIVGMIRAAAEEVKEENDMPEFYKKLDERFGIDRTLWIYVTDSNIHYIQYRHTSLRYSMNKKNYPWGKEKTQEGKKRKSKFKIALLDDIKREGVDYRHGRHTSVNVWEKTFHFRGVEFGNWLSQKDRQDSMDYCFDALKDMAIALKINDSDLTFDGSLALAFGARGHAGAVAHYEPLLQVINLTKLHGAGSTAHEWMHALDHKSNRFYNPDASAIQLASEHRSGNFPDEFKDLLHALKFTQDNKYTEFYTGSRFFDYAYSKDSFGYWSSSCEMLARAYACYMKDKLGNLGYRCDYLVAHADGYVAVSSSGKTVYAIPLGEERKEINKRFDLFFERLKKDGFFHQREEAKINAGPQIISPSFLRKHYEEMMMEEENGQYTLAI